MGRISLAELNRIAEQERKAAQEQNAGLVFKKATPADKKAVDTVTTMYRIEFPAMSYDQAVALFNRMDMFMRRNIKDDSTLVILGLSSHKHWTPYAEVSGSKGGAPKKVFSAMPCYKVPPHVHLDILGNKARSLSERIYKNQSRQMKLKPFKDTVRSQHSFCPSYIRWQSDLYREFGGAMDAFIADTDILNFA